jgi:hypothetical protein
MRWKVSIAALAIVGAAVGIAVYAWPAAAKLPKPRVIHTAPARQLPVARTLRGDYEAHDFDLSQLIPRGSRINRVWYAPARGYHRQVLVEWTDPHTYVRWGHLGQRIARWGLTLWSSTGSRWQAVRIPAIEFPGPGPADIHIAFADVTGDGRADLLFEQDPGTNHGCGPHQVFATSPHGVTTRVFSSYLCETPLGGDHGLLALDMPNYIRNDAMCCASFREDLRLRWDGRRFVQDSVHVYKSAPY